MQKRGILILTFLCLSLFALQQWQNARPVKSPFARSPILLEPLTVQEKILLGMKLPLNRLGAEELEVLPHISARVAKKIVAYRLKNGPFKNVEALTNIAGIGIKTLEWVRPFLVTSSSTF